MTNDEIQNIFFLECEEALALAEQGLLACRSGDADAETVNGIFRAVHSIKGGAGAFSFTGLQSFTHKFETLLSYVRDGDLKLSDELNTLMLRAFDMLADHVTAVRGEGDTPDDAALGVRLEEVAAQAAAGMTMLEGSATGAEVAETDPAPADEVPGADDLGLDFDLDSLMGDLLVSEEESAAIEAAAAEIELAMDSAPPSVAAMHADLPVAGASSGEDTPFGSCVSVRFGDAALANGSEPLLMLREVERLGGVCLAVDAADLPQLGAFDADKAYIAWKFYVPGHVGRASVDEIFDFIRPDCDLRIEPLTEPLQRDGVMVTLPEANGTGAPCPKTLSADKNDDGDDVTVDAQVATVADESVVTSARQTPGRVAASVGQTVRVDLAKLDKLIDTVGELVIAQAMVAQRLATHGLSSIDEMGMLDLLTRDIQESAMSIRAQPIGSVFSRVPRIVRELEADTGKRVVLTMTGEATELDKTVVERLGEPLTHLIRNAVDHGIEKPDERVAKGKPAEGALHLSAEQRSGRIVISLTDDGAGINREAVLKKAIDKGLVASGTQLSHEEIDNLIFAPGFSTAEKVSNISGRGVGMDVVRQNVKDLGGRISIESRPDKGCTFTLALPLTLAIADGMIVTVGDQTVVIPLTHVLESLRPEDAEVKYVGKDLMVLNNRGRFLPIVRLDASVGALGAAQAAKDAVLIVVDTETHGQAVLMVDGIVDQRQFVIKSLEAHYQPVTGVAGATILGDGKVALILDVDALVADNFASHGAALAAA